MRFFLYLILPYLLAWPETSFSQSVQTANLSRIAVGIPPQEELVRRLAGKDLEIEVLLPSGSNHESYEPTFGQLLAISRASLFIKVGHPSFTLETLLLEKIIALNPNLRIVNGADTLALREGDIHYWTSPRRLSQVAATTAEVLKNLLPQNATLIEKNKEGLLRELQALDGELRELFAPFQGRSFLVFHPAWGYLAEDYGLKQLAIENDGKEPGVRRASEILALAKQARIHTIFIEPGSAEESIAFFSEELRANVETLNPLAKDWTNSLRDSARAIAKSFGGVASL